MDVGIRELKASLSEHVRRAQHGESVVITDRGRPIARLVPIEHSAVARGIEEGWIDAPARRSLETPLLRRPLRSTIGVLHEDRG